MESLLDIRTDHGQDSTLCSSLRDILILQVLSSGKAVILIEECSDIRVVVPEYISSGGIR